MIDDNRLIGEAIRRTLRSHEVRVETDPNAALEAIKAGERFDLTLCDFYMPGLRGDGVFQAVSVFAPEMIPGFVFLTGGGPLSPNEQAAIESAPGGFLLKPFDTNELRLLAAAGVRRGSVDAPQGRARHPANEAGAAESCPPPRAPQPR